MLNAVKGKTLRKEGRRVYERRNASQKDAKFMVLSKTRAIFKG
jgi:hypothetical protein